MTTAAPAERTLITGGAPDEPYALPILQGEFTPAPDLERIGIALMNKHFNFESDLSVIFLWKARGGKNAGSCQRPNGLLGYFSETDYVIWLAADHIDGQPYSRWQVEALLYHYLKHIDAEPDEEGKIEKGIRPYEFQGYRDEIALYGFWQGDLAAMARTVQRKLPGFAEEREFEILPPPRPVRPGDELLHEAMTIEVEDDLPQVADLPLTV